MMSQKLRDNLTSSQLMVKDMTVQGVLGHCVDRKLFRGFSVLYAEQWPTLPRWVEFVRKPLFRSISYSVSGRVHST